MLLSSLLVTPGDPWRPLATPGIPVFIDTDLQPCFNRHIFPVCPPVSHPLPVRTPVIGFRAQSESRMILSWDPSLITSKNFQKGHILRFWMNWVFKGHYTIQHNWAKPTNQPTPKPWHGWPMSSTGQGHGLPLLSDSSVTSAFRTPGFPTTDRKCTKKQHS